MKFLILQGIPASGKSTWAKQFVKENTDYVRVCRDDLRRMRGVYWLPEQEDLISGWEKGTICKALESGYNVVLDATNLNGKHLRQWINLAATYKAEVEFKRFDTTLEECLKRDASREESVGEAVIRNMYKNYAKLDVTMKALESVREDVQVIEKVVQDPNLASALIVDLDGTLAMHCGRSAYEFHRCDEDLLNVPVANLVKMYMKNHKVILYTSGREDSCKQKTVEWLCRHDLWKAGMCSLFMRKTGDRRKDCIVKKEIFDTLIHPNYFVDLVLDDRLQVCRMWHQLGLTLLRVGDPEANF